MKITGKNSAVGQTAEDVVTKGGVITLPTQARIHAIVSNDAKDDSDGTLQVETATARGTVEGILQVETATIAGTIGVAGAGNAKVTVTGAMIAGSPLEISVAVANEDTASLVAGKIRTALAIAAVNTNYTVSGATDKFILTKKVAAANDASLNIAFDNDTCTGLTANATSANTTAGHAGTGNASVIVTSAILENSPITVDVPVVVGDTAEVWAGKARARVAANTEIAAAYTVGGATDKIILIAKTAAANDATLNVATENGTCNGISTTGSSADTTAGVAPGVGARTVEISGINAAYKEVSETVSLNGTAAVNTVNSYLHINSMQVKSAGSEGANAGLITAIAATDTTITAQIEIGRNKAQQCIFLNINGPAKSINYFTVSAKNATAGAITTVDIWTKKQGGVWIPEITVELDSSNPTFTDVRSGFLPILSTKTLIKVMATASAGSSSVNCSFEVK